MEKSIKLDSLMDVIEVLIREYNTAGAVSNISITLLSHEYNKLIDAFQSERIKQ